MVTKSVPVYPIILIPTFADTKNLSPCIKPHGSGSVTVGASEERFGQVLKYYFGDWVRSQQEMLPKGHDRPYTADFAIIEPNSYILILKWMKAIVFIQENQHILLAMMIIGISVLWMLDG